MSQNISEDILDITENLRILGTGGTYAVSFPAPTSLTGNVTFPLPTNNASANQIYVTVSSTSGQWQNSSIFQSALEVYTLKDIKSSGTNSGTFTSGAWRTRTLNTLTKIPVSASYVSLASNQITVQAGTYLVQAKAPANDVDSHQCRLRNITDNTTTIVGSSEQTASNGVDTSSCIIGLFTIASTKVFELQHRCQTKEVTDGFGHPAGFGENETYAMITFTRLA